MVAPVIDWPAIEEGLRQWVIASTELPDGAVYWGRPNAPQPLRPMAWLEVITGLTHAGRPGEHRWSQLMRDRIEITAANAGPYTLRLHDAGTYEDEGVPYTYSGPSDTIAQVRDGWAAILGDSPYDVSTDGDDILIDGTEGFPHFHAVVEAGAASRATEREAVAAQVYSIDRFTLRLQVEVGPAAGQLSVGPGQPAMDLLSRAALNLRHRNIRRSLYNLGVARYRTNPPVNVSRMLGDKHVSRGAQDFVFNTLSTLEVEQLPWIRVANTAGAVAAEGGASPCL